jgi:hypothetical protein
LGDRPNRQNKVISGDAGRELAKKSKAEAERSGLFIGRKEVADGR